MKKTHQLLIGLATVCLCFFLTAAVGSFHTVFSEISDEQDAEAEGASTHFPSSDEASTNVPKPSPSESEDFLDDLHLMQLPQTTGTVPSPTPTLTPAPTLTPTPTPSPTPTPTPAPKPFQVDFAVAAVSNNLNIRKSAGTNATIIGKLHRNGYAAILERGAEWTKISTGNIKEGYVSTKYLFLDDEVLRICDELEAATAVVKVSALNVRSGPGTEFDRVNQVTKNEVFPAILTKSYEGWIAIRLPNRSIGYVSAEHVRLEYDLEEGLTLKEIEDAEKKAKAEEAMARARVTFIPETTRTTKHTLTDAEMKLFATVIYNEAGDQGYDGMLAVANVILNRMEDGYWGTSLEEVLFAPGQFAGAKKEYIERAQKRGVPDICYEIGRVALSGRNNIGDYLFFCADYIAEYSKYDQFYVLKNHVFYKRRW